MLNGILTPPTPINEPVLEYAPDSIERNVLQQQLQKMLGEQIEIPLQIGGKAVTTGNLADCVCPHDHTHLLARYHQAGEQQTQAAIDAAIAAAPAWAAMPWEARAAIFLRAAELLATKYRPLINAATMLGQSKTVHQAEIDAACELIDFLRFNVSFANELYRQQPQSSAGCWNQLDHRPLEGFVFAVSPFNFTAIAGNLCTAPAMLGNTIVWKPASTAVYSAHFLYQLLCEAGLPPGVINLVCGRGGAVGNPVLQDRRLAGIHFTGSTGVFQQMWRTVGGQIERYRCYPRIVGETGGKDFIVAHPSADAESLVTAIVRGGFEYQGQKCSAASRVYLPQSLYGVVVDRLVEATRSLKMGAPTDFQNFVAAVIDRSAFESISEYISYAQKSADAEVLIGGRCDGERGFFIEPTVVVARTPDFRLLREEIFGPVVTLYVYQDRQFDQVLELCDQTSPYALTGAIFANDRQAVEKASAKLRQAAGNFYINDKPTGAVVGQQPFGGARASGTNDKAGSVLNLLRWISPRTIKETFVPPTDHRYPYMR